MSLTDFYFLYVKNEVLFCEYNISNSLDIRKQTKRPF